MSKELFFQEREESSWIDYTDMPTYQEVTDSDTAIESMFSKVDKLDKEIESLQKRKDQVLQNTKKLAFSFFNDQNLPMGLVYRMIEKRNHPYFYIRSIEPLIFTSGPFYKGDYYEKCKCYINPYSSDDSIKAKIKRWERENY